MTSHDEKAFHHRKYSDTEIKRSNGMHLKYNSLRAEKRNAYFNSNMASGALWMRSDIPYVVHPWSITSRNVSDNQHFCVFLSTYSMFSAVDQLLMVRYRAGAKCSWQWHSSEWKAKFDTSYLQLALRIYTQPEYLRLWQILACNIPLLFTLTLSVYRCYIDTSNRFENISREASP